MRDKLIHQYFGVDMDAVWNVVQTGLPELVAEARMLLAKIDERSAENG